MTRRPDHKLGFTVTSQRIGDGNKFLPCAVFQCTRCEEQLAIPFNGRMNPEMLAKAAVRQGWKAHPERASEARCYRCMSRKEPGEGPKEIDVASAKLADVTKVELRAASTEEKRRVREMMDKHFDDATGRYLDGWTDAKVGHALNIPHAIVTFLREAAYGPLNKADPELDALKQAVDAIRKEADVFCRGIVKKLDELQDRIIAKEKSSE